MTSALITIGFVLAIAAWFYGTAIFLPWWWRRFKGEQTSLSKRETIHMLVAYGFFALAVAIPVTLLGE